MMTFIIQATGPCVGVSVAYEAKEWDWFAVHPGIADDQSGMLDGWRADNGWPWRVVVWPWLLRH